MFRYTKILNYSGNIFSPEGVGRLPELFWKNPIVLLMTFVYFQVKFFTYLRRPDVSEFHVLFTCAGF